MAYEAASLVMKQYDIDPASIGLVVVGTETAVDEAKPVASYLHGLLKLNRFCRTFDTKHACYSATAALRMAASWVLTQGSRGRRMKALIVATDISRYGKGSVGEPTQGAGAVAMVVSDEARCLLLEPHPEAVYTEEVMDFWRPHYMSSALVDGKTSIDAYLRALSSTWPEFTATSGLGWDDFKYMLFHVPFPKMAYKAMRRLHELEFRDKGLTGPDLDEAFEKRTQPALWANRELGNCYSGSLYLSLAGLLEHGDRMVEGTRVGLFSYGSGCCAEFFSGRVGPDASAWRGRIGLDDGLSRRQELTYERYLHFRGVYKSLAQESSCVEYFPDGSSTGSLVFRGIRDHKRVYTRVEPLAKVARSDSPKAQIWK